MAPSPARVCKRHDPAATRRPLVAKSFPEIVGDTEEHLQHGNQEGNTLRSGGRASD